VDSIDGWNDLEKLKFLTLPELEIRPLGRLAHNQTIFIIIMIVTII
jgi:hypothetical protein